MKGRDGYEIRRHKKAVALLRVQAKKATNESPLELLARNGLDRGHDDRRGRGRRARQS